MLLATRARAVAPPASAAATSTARRASAAPLRRPLGLTPRAGVLGTPPPVPRRPGLVRERRVREVPPPPPPSAYSPYPTDPLASNTGPLGAASSAGGTTPPTPVAVSEAARTRLFRAADACRKVGWASFWTQLALSLVSAGILLFSVAFTASNGPGAALYLTLFGVVASFLSTFWAYGYTRLARRLRATAAAAARGGGPVLVRKDDVIAAFERGAALNIAGLAATLLGLQATVGLLVAKTLTNATANPFLAGGAGSYSPVLALDVFLVQASTNTAAAHFVSLLATLWLTRVINRPAPYVAGKPA